MLSSTATQCVNDALMGEAAHSILTGVDVLEPVVRYVAGEPCHLTGWLRQLVQGLHKTHPKHNVS